MRWREKKNHEERLRERDCKEVSFPRTCLKVLSPMSVIFTQLQNHSDSQIKWEYLKYKERLLKKRIFLRAGFKFSSFVSVIQDQQLFSLIREI